MAPPPDLVALAVLLFANRLVVPRILLRAPLFWAFQVVNLAGAVLVAIFGLPGIPSYPVVSWMVAALLAFHVAQNASLRSRALHDVQRVADEQELRRIRREIRDDGPG